MLQHTQGELNMRSMPEHACSLPPLQAMLYASIQRRICTDRYATVRSLVKFFHFPPKAGSRHNPQNTCLHHAHLCSGQQNRPMVAASVFMFNTKKQVNCYGSMLKPYSRRGAGI